MWIWLVIFLLLLISTTTVLAATMLSVRRNAQVERILRAKPDYGKRTSHYHASPESSNNPGYANRGLHDENQEEPEKELGLV